MKQAINSFKDGCSGYKISCSGRLAGAEIARKSGIEKPSSSPYLAADIDYGFARISHYLWKIGVKVWIFKGEVISPESRRKDAGLWAMIKK